MLISFPSYCLEILGLDLQPPQHSHDPVARSSKHAMGRSHVLGMRMPADITEKETFGFNLSNHFTI
jgi:hypothetical protein